VIRIGCTGHQRLSPATRRQTAAAIATVLASFDDQAFVGITSLAEGADQIFALTVLASGGELRAVIPSEGYESSFRSDDGRATYSRLLELAESRLVMPFPAPSEDAFLAAGHEVVNSCDLLLAVWDGQRAGGKGGTADIVAYARTRGIDTRIIWPDGAIRV